MITSRMIAKAMALYSCDIYPKREEGRIEGGCPEPSTLAVLEYYRWGASSATWVHKSSRKIKRPKIGADDFDFP